MSTGQQTSTNSNSIKRNIQTLEDNNNYEPSAKRQKLTQNNNNHNHNHNVSSSNLNDEHHQQKETKQLLFVSSQYNVSHFV